MSNKYTGRDGEICRNCVYYTEVKSLDLSQQVGECRRFPPVAAGIQMGHGQIATFCPWPQVKKDLWCGEGQHPEAGPEITP